MLRRSCRSGWWSVLGRPCCGRRRRMRRRSCRRRRQSGLSKYLGKLLGFEMKLRQYQQGKIFCDAIVAEAGPGALTAVFSSQEALPTLDEIKDPVAWLRRSQGLV